MSNVANKAGEPRATAESIMCEIVSLNAGFQDIRATWGRRMAISGAQLSTMTAIAVLDRGGGVSVKETASRMRVGPSFITLCTKPLEKKGFLRRRMSPADARVILMSLTESSSDLVAAILDEQLALCRSIFADFDDQELDRFARILRGANTELSRKRCRSAPLHLASRHGK